MSETPAPPRRRLFDRSAAVPTLLAEGGRFEGRFATRGPLTLAGEVVGDGEVGGLLTVLPQAHWRGDVLAANAAVAGQITGNLLVAGKLEIGRTARIRGDVRAQSLAIAHGAIVEGELQVTGTEPVVRFGEKRGC